MSQVTQPSLLRAVVGFALRFFKCRALRGCPRSILTEEAVSPQGGGNGDLPPREQPGQTMQLWAHYLIDREFHMAKVRCSQERSLRLVFVITTDSGCWINFSLFLSILSYTASQTLFCSNFLVNQPIREKTSQISTRPCQVCSLLAIAPNQHRMMLNNKSALRGWRYPGPWQGSGNIVVYNCKPSVYE